MNFPPKNEISSLKMKIYPTNDIFPKNLFSHKKLDFFTEDENASPKMKFRPKNDFSPKIFFSQKWIFFLQN
jgi:hypothetical protein